MRTAASLLFIVSVLFAHTSTGQTNFAERRQRAAAAFHDGIVLLHASSRLDLLGDGFHQDPHFYYFTGLENTVGAVLAIEGKSGESWLFLPSDPPYGKAGLKPEVRPGSEDAKRLGVEHVVDWSDLNDFLSSRSSQGAVLYFAAGWDEFGQLPQSLLNSKAPGAPLWLQIVLQKWPAFEAKDATRRIEALMEVQDADEIGALRKAAKTTVSALMAGMQAIRPNVSQRSVEEVVASACWNQGAHGVDFWPWAMAGENAVFPHPFFSGARYDHLNRTMLAGELVRLDVGCEWEHYQGRPGADGAGLGSLRRSAAGNVDDIRRRV